MKTIKKNVYYCDFCKKKGLSAGHMNTHEKHCTANPDRYCRMCDCKPDIKKHIRLANKMVKKYIKGGTNGVIIDEDGPDSGKTRFERDFDLLITQVVECPACTLAVVRQADDGVIVNANYDYKKAVDEFWADKAQEERRQEEEIMRSTYA